MPQPARRGEQQHEPEGDDLVPDDAAVVGFAERPAGDLDEPDAGQVGDGEQEEQLAVAEVGTEQDEAGPGEQRAEGARRPRRQPAAAAAGEEMRRVGEQEADAGGLGKVVVPLARDIDRLPVRVEDLDRARRPGDHLADRPER
ncbi:hypothetical protein SDC9_202649 [bioreactor metagenome]|uniref:Uncharacterized protein n=1 Tax=bioreactor metagenome TaxID=1076179 RepID=A0A645IVQ8_9ZZZZ